MSYTPNCSHYFTQSQKTRDRLVFSKFAAKTIATLLKDTNTHPGLIYTGMSGCSIATSVADKLLEQHNIHPNMYYVRKEEEKSHGYKVEICSIRKKNLCFFFIDDFISTGKTLLNTLATINDIDYENYVEEFKQQDQIFSKDKKDLWIVTVKPSFEFSTKKINDGTSDITRLVAQHNFTLRGIRYKYSH